MADPKEKQLRELLTKSVHYITANLNLLEKEVVRFGLQNKLDQMTAAARVVVDITKLLDVFPTTGTYTPNEIPPQIASKLNEKQLSMIKKLDGLFWEITDKLTTIQHSLETPSKELDKNVAVRISAANQLVKDYVASLTTSKDALPVQAL